MFQELPQEKDYSNLFPLQAAPGIMCAGLTSKNNVHKMEWAQKRVIKIIRDLDQPL